MNKLVDEKSFGGIMQTFADRFGAIDREQQREREGLIEQFEEMLISLYEGDLDAIESWLEFALKHLRKGEPIIKISE